MNRSAEHLLAADAQSVAAEADRYASWIRVKDSSSLRAGAGVHPEVAPRTPGQTSGQSFRGKSDPHRLFFAPTARPARWWFVLKKG